MVRDEFKKAHEDYRQTHEDTMTRIQEMYRMAQDEIMNSLAQMKDFVSQMMVNQKPGKLFNILRASVFIILFSFCFCVCATATIISGTSRIRARHWVWTGHSSTTSRIPRTACGIVYPASHPTANAHAYARRFCYHTSRRADDHLQRRPRCTFSCFRAQ